tara:strand:+ start:1420 stop:1554 length:135 start_codon:yes stop_codon:yes gene_type:complete
LAGAVAMMSLFKKIIGIEKYAAGSVDKNNLDAQELDNGQVKVVC